MEGMLKKSGSIEEIYPSYYRACHDFYLTLQSTNDTQAVSCPILTVMKNTCNYSKVQTRNVAELITACDVYVSRKIRDENLKKVVIHYAANFPDMLFNTNELNR